MEIIAAGDVRADRLSAYVTETWRADFVVAHGEQIRPADLPGFVAMEGERVAGHAAYRIGPEGCELVTISAEPRRAGIGSRLLERVIGAARDAGCSRLWLTTTNDNLDALRFYQRRGFRLYALRTGVVRESRRLKPDLPAAGDYDIPIRDELDLEMHLER